ncbi:MAG: threonine ammonia-lyase [Bacteriovoracia bacterium]
MSKVNVEIEDIEQARGVLRKYLEPTPLIYNRWLSEIMDCSVFLKLENMQPIGSFKIRGATYKISRLTKAQRKKGVIAASAGNHAQGVAWGALQFGTKATIIMAKTASITKIERTKALGAHVILDGNNYDEAFQIAKKVSKKTGKVFVHPFEDPDVISGQGTVGLEIAEQLPEVDTVIGSLGGGGLMAGVSLALKAIKPNVEIVGTQASGASSLVRMIKSGKPGDLTADTFADGVRVMKPSSEMAKVLRPIIDRTLTASDDEIALALLVLLEKAKVIAEGAGALPFAVLKANQKLFRGKNVVLIVSGGNIDISLLARIVERGLILSGRRLRLDVHIKDFPGSLLRVTQELANLHANVIQVIHDRNALSMGINETRVELTLETRDPEHANEIIKTLKQIVVKVDRVH